MVNRSHCDQNKPNEALLGREYLPTSETVKSASETISNEDSKYATIEWASSGLLEPGPEWVEPWMV